jgi:uncharacterized membrane protein YfcA
MDILSNPAFYIPILLLIGLIAGFITGIMGGSGVVVVVPFLMILGMDVHSSIGTSLFVDVIASAVAAYTYWQNKNLDMSRGLWMAIAAVIGAQFGSLVASNASSGGMSWGFGVYLLILGAALLKTGIQSITDRVQKFSGKFILGDGPETPEKKKKLIIISIIAGLVIGLISGLFGAGGGIMFLIVLILVLGYELHIAVGTSTLIMAITATSGSIGFALQGNLDIWVAIVVSLGTLISGRFGSKIANKWSIDTLGKAIALTLMGLGIIMLIFSI